MTKKSTLLSSCPHCASPLTSAIAVRMESAIYLGLGRHVAIVSKRETRVEVYTVYMKVNIDVQYLNGSNWYAVLSHNSQVT